MSYDYLRSAPIRRLHNPLEENPIWKILGSAITSVFAVAIGLPFLLAFFFLLPACLSVRWLLLFIHWKRRGSHSRHGPESVRGNDSRWLGTAWNSSVIHAVLIFEANDRLNVDNFRHILLTRVIPLYPRLTRRPISLPLYAGIGHCWLQDAKFSIDRHVFPGPSLTSEKDLQNYISKLLKDGLPQDKPPWEFQILHPFGEGQDTVAVLRVHQSVADGTALLRVLCQSLADSQEIEIPHGPAFGSFSFCVNVFRACIVGPLSLLIWLFFSAEDCNILTRRSAWTGSLTVTWSASITLPKVIRIKQVTRSTVNCVLLSALAGALRRFLQGCGVKHPPDIKAVLPMDLRNPTSSMRISSRLGNKSSPVFVSLPVAVEGCVPRLWATRKTLDSLRNSADPIILYVATTALMTVGPSSIARDLIDSITDKASLQFSSLPGPTSEIYVGGQTLKAIYPLLPAQAKLGISITAITYADQVFVSVIAERALGPAAELILEYLEDQVEVLWNLLLHRRVPGETRSSSTFIHFSASDSSAEDIASRLNFVQQEVQRISENSENDEDENLYSLRAEFSELVGELKRRHSLNEIDELDVLRRPRRRALSCSSTRKQVNTQFNSFLSKRDHSTMERGEELHEIREENDNELGGPNTEFKEVVCLLAENSEASPEASVDAFYSKIRLARRKRSKYDADDKFESNVENKNENSSTYVNISEGGQENEESGMDRHSEVSPKNSNESSMEIIIEKTKHAKCQSKHNNVRSDEARMRLEEAAENTSKIFCCSSGQKWKKSGGWESSVQLESNEGNGKAETDINPSRNTSGKEFKIDCEDLTKYLGPINTDLRDLYCSNYLQHKLEMLHKEKNRLEREMRAPNYEIYGGDGFDEGDDTEIAGGVLI